MIKRRSLFWAALFGELASGSCDAGRLGGDTLKTGELGTLGVTFADQTTIRIGRQSTLVVNAIAPDAQQGKTELTLSGGAMWARASRGGAGVTVKTPAVSAAIRGTCTEMIPISARWLRKALRSWVRCPTRSSRPPYDA